MSDCYVGRKSCGCPVAAVVDNPEHKHDTARAIADWIRSGLTIERQSIEWVRANLHTCKCGAATEGDGK